MVGVRMAARVLLVVCLLTPVVTSIEPLAEKRPTHVVGREGAVELAGLGSLLRGKKTPTAPRPADPTVYTSLPNSHRFTLPYVVKNDDYYRMVSMAGVINLPVQGPLDTRVQIGFIQRKMWNMQKIERLEAVFSNSGTGWSVQTMYRAENKILRQQSVPLGQIMATPDATLPISFTISLLQRNVRGSCGSSPQCDSYSIDLLAPRRAGGMFKFSFLVMVPAFTIWGTVHITEETKARAFAMPLRVSTLRTETDPKYDRPSIANWCQQRYVMLASNAGLSMSVKSAAFEHDPRNPARKWCVFQQLLVTKKGARLRSDNSNSSEESEIEQSDGADLVASNPKPSSESAAPVALGVVLAAVVIVVVAAAGYTWYARRRREHIGDKARDQPEETPSRQTSAVGTHQSRHHDHPPRIAVEGGRAVDVASAVPHKTSVNGQRIR